MSSDAPARNVAAALKWSGPALAVLGAGAIALLAAASSSPLARWTLTETLAPARVLPLIGLGAAFALIGARSFGTALLLFGLGIVTGFKAEDLLLRVLDPIPQAATHLYLAGPISYLAAGVTLVAGGRLRTCLTPAAAALIGAMLALAIQLTDPSLHDPRYTWTPIALAFWIVAAVALTLRAFARPWFKIFARILGSWLLAIGLLYGGASLVPVRQAPPPIALPEPPKDAPVPGPDSAIPGLPGDDEPAPDSYPGGLNRLQQP